MLRQISWEEIRKDVSKVNPKLATIIDQISPTKKHTLYLANYRFGDLIVDKGVTYLPSDDGTLHSISSNKFKTDIVCNLGNTSIPLALSLNTSNEVFVSPNSHVVPLNIITPGDMFGVFEAVDDIFNIESRPVWSVSAGARTLFTLPKISDAVGIDRLRKQFSLPSVIRIKKLADQWHLFRALAASSNFQHKWEARILFFGKSWLQILKNTNSEWQDFYQYLYKKAWQQKQFSLERTVFGLNWREFIDAVSDRNYAPRPYITDTVRNIILILSGYAPAIAAVTDRNIAGPIRGLQEAIIDTYQLKKYIPTFMQAVVPSNTEFKHPYYYSLHHPIMLEGMSTDKNSSTLISDLRNIKSLIETFKQQSKQAFRQRVANFEISYHHAEQDIYGDIEQSIGLQKTDRMLMRDIKQFPEREFCSSSQFWRGSIQFKAR